MAQIGSALEWGSRGRRFNSCHSDQENRNTESIHCIDSVFLFCCDSIVQDIIPKYTGGGRAGLSIAIDDFGTGYSSLCREKEY